MNYPRSQGMCLITLLQTCLCRASEAQCSWLGVRQKYKDHRLSLPSPSKRINSFYTALTFAMQLQLSMIALLGLAGNAFSFSGFISQNGCNQTTFDGTTTLAATCNNLRSQVNLNDCFANQFGLLVYRRGYDCLTVARSLY